MKKYTNKEILKRIARAEKNKDKLQHIKLKPFKVDIATKIVTWVDPPSGHKHGFPKILPDDVVDFKQWLLDNGYPKRDIEFALQWCRMWKEEIEE